MAKRLRKFEDAKTGELYYLDLKLGEFRNVKNPHDSFPIMSAKRLMRPIDKESTPRRSAQSLRLENYV